MSKVTVIILIALGCILLAIANVALWATLDIFNADRFGERIAEGLQSPQATEALAGPIVDLILAEQTNVSPLIRRAAEEVVAWLLQRPIFRPIFKETAAVAHVVMTTSGEDVVGIDISEVGDYVLGIVSAIDPETGEQARAAIDSSEERDLLTIYQAGLFPKLREISLIVPWLWPLAGLGAIALFAAAYWWAENRRQALKAIGIGVVVVGVLELLLIPAIHALVQNNVIDPAMLAVVGSVIQVMTRDLAILCLLLIFIGVVILGIEHYHFKEEDQTPTSLVN